MDPATLTASALTALIRSRQLSAEEATRATLARIDRLNPALNAIVQRRDEDALAEACALDARLAKGEDPGPLAGVPVTVKVNIDQAGFATTNGLRIQATLIATEDSPPVANLRRAGAVIVGRTNTPAFSLRWFTRNALHGATRNPAFPALTPGGSSGGAASAVAAGMGPPCPRHRHRRIDPLPRLRLRHPRVAPRPGPRPRLQCHRRGSPDRRATHGRLRPAGPLRRRPPPRPPGPVPARPARPLAHPGCARPLPQTRRPCPDTGRPPDRPRDPAGPDRCRQDPASPRLGNRHPRNPPLPRGYGAATHPLALRIRPGRGRGIAREADPDATFVHRELTKLAPPPTLESFMRALQSRARLARLWRGFFTDWPVLLTPVSGELPFPDHYDTSSAQAFAKVIEAQMPQIAPPFMGLPGLALTTGRTPTHPIAIQALADRGNEHILLDLADLLAPEIPAVTP